MIREHVKRARAFNDGKAAAKAGRSSASHGDIRPGTIFYDDWCDGYREGERENIPLMLLRETRAEIADALEVVRGHNAKGGLQITGSTFDDLGKMVAQIDEAIGPAI